MDKSLESKTGIWSEGSGNVYRYVSMNPAVPLASKAVYFYFCSFGDPLNPNTRIYPSLKTICEDLCMSMATARKAIEYLIKADLVIRSKEESNEGKEYTEYRINVKPIGYYPPKNAKIRTGTILDHKYGPIPRKVMRDKTKSFKGKVLYGYYCSFIGEEQYGIIDVNTVCYYLGIKKLDTYYAMRKEIEGTYVVHERVHEAGTVGVKGVRVHLLDFNISREDFEQKAGSHKEKDKDTAEQQVLQEQELKEKEIPEDFKNKIGFYNYKAYLDLMNSIWDDKGKEEVRQLYSLSEDMAKALWKIAQNSTKLKKEASAQNVLAKYMYRVQKNLSGSEEPCQYQVTNMESYMITCLSNEQIE